MQYPYKPTIQTLATCLIVALVSTVSAAVDIESLRNRSSEDLQAQSDKVWNEHLRPGAFQDKEINEAIADSPVEIKAPYRAEDAAVVPVSIHAKIPQTAEHYIKKLHVYLDKNPLPLVGVFEFTPQSGRADLAMRIRADGNTFFRVVTEMNDGKLFMSKSFIRALGGCSEPLGASVDESLKRMGKMKINTIGELELGQPNLVQLKISHPNITGLGASQRTGVRPPPHFVTKLKINYAEKMIMRADLTFAISQDPSFRLFFIPYEQGKLTVEAVDSKNNRFKSTHAVVVL